MTAHIVLPAEVGSGAYTHTQATPLSVILVQHNLGFRPTGNFAWNSELLRREHPVVQHLSDTQLLATFGEPFVGTLDLS